jgi:UDP-N-acetyl-2-amino-2-deoxyglucuronate dehydrogenase
VTVHVGLIGAGNISDTHARAACDIPGVTIAAVYAPTREHAVRLAARHGAAAHDTLEGLLAHRPLEMVAIGSPSGLHAEHGVAAARHGLHVLVEKPIDISTVGADRLIAEAARAAVVLGVMFQDRLKPDVRRLKELIESGRLGTPILAAASVKWYRPPEYYGGSRWRGTREFDGGGALMNQGVHTVDLLLWLFGPVRRVFGRAATRLHAIEVEDTAVAVLEFTSGAIGTLEAATSAYPGYARRLELTGTEGTLVLEGDRLTRTDLRGQPANLPAAEPAPAPESVASPVVTDATPHRRLFENFIGAIESRGTPSCDGPGGRRSVEVIEAIYRSAVENQPIDIVPRA